MATSDVSVVTPGQRGVNGVYVLRKQTAEFKAEHKRKMRNEH